MKLRIKGNSIRLRLLRSEVDRLAVEGRIEEMTSFGANAFRYSVAASQATDKVYAVFENDEIRVFIPEAAALAWVANGQVGFEAEQSVGDDVLTILIEKDFVCLDRPDDPDRHDAFPNPNTTC